MNLNLSRREVIRAVAIGSAALAVPPRNRAFAQQQGPRVTFGGTIVSIEGQVITAMTPTGQVTMVLASGGTVWKRYTRRDISRLIVGDNLVVSGYFGAGGVLEAVDIRANVASFFGLIQNTSAGGFQVHTRYGFVRNVQIGPDTLDSRNMPISAGEIRPGREALVVGLKLPDGTVQATKVLIYEDGRQVPFSPGTVIIDPQTGRPAG